MRPYKQSIKAASLTFIFVASYFIVWTFWYRDDFNIYLYYGAICLVSILASYAIYKMLQSVTKKLKKLNSISKEIPKLEHDIDYINGIADLMPENEETVTYKAMLDTTGDDLKRTYRNIENELKDEEEITEGEIKK